MTNDKNRQQNEKPFAMEKPKYQAKINNIYFLTRVGSTLRWATQDVAQEELPSEIKRLLNRLDRLEAKAEAKRREDTDPAG